MNLLIKGTMLNQLLKDLMRGYACYFKRYLFAALVIVLAVLASPTAIITSEAAVPANILKRVFCLRIGSELATGFTVEVEDRQYLITAKHTLTNSPIAIEVLNGTNWVKMPIKCLLVEPPTIDIAVLALPRQLSGLPAIQLGIKGSYISQEVYFLGFPYGLTMNGQALNSGFPIPIVKHGIIAAFGNKLGEPFFVDGINNRGFSGGPVIRVEASKELTIIGVVSGYLSVYENVYRDRTNTTNSSVQVNTGLLIAFEIERAIDAIKKNPIGFPIRSTH